MKSSPPQVTGSSSLYQTAFLVLWKQLFQEELFARNEQISHSDGQQEAL